MTDDIKDDLAYVRAMAEEGRTAPLVSGVLYVLWGSLVGAGALAEYVVWAGVVSLGPNISWLIWAGVFIAGWGFSRIVGARIGQKPGAQTIGNRTAASAWFAVGLFATGFWLTMTFAHDNYTSSGVPAYFLFGLMFPVAFGLYGIAFFASATAAQALWLRWFAFAAWSFSFVAMFLIGNPLQMVVAALGSFVCAVAPGLILMRNEPSEIV